MTLLFCTKSFSLNEKNLYVHSIKGSNLYSGKYPEVKVIKGKKDGPYATLNGALENIRNLRRKDKGYKYVNIFLRGGSYRIFEPILIKDENIHIRNYKNENVVFEPTKRLNQFRKVKQFKEYTLYKTRFNENCPMEAFISRKKLIRARKPNVKKWTGSNFSGEGPYLYIDNLLKPTKSCDRKGSGGFRQECPDENKYGFIYKGKDIKKTVGNRKSEIDILIFQSWTAERGRVQYVINANKTVIFEKPLKFKVGSHPRSSGWRYIVENAFSELDNPGEFYCSKRMKLFYVALPKSFEKMILRKGIQIPRQSRQLIIKNTENCSISGINFVKTASEEINFHRAPAAIEIYYSNNINIKNSNFLDIGYTGIYAMSVKKLKVSFCNFRRIGYMGVAIDYMNDPSSINSTQDIFITQNTFTQCGMTNMLQPSCIHARGSRNINIMNNHIYNTCYAGIRAGWQQGFKVDYVKRDEYVFKIERNHIHHFGQGILNDFGGIYLSMNQQDCKINQKDEVCHLHALVRHNVIHHSQSYLYGGTGIHCDTAASSVIIESNWLYRLYDGAFLFHCGINNKAFGNVVYQTGNRRMIGTCNKVMTGKNGLLPRQEFKVFGNVFYIENTEALMWRKSDFWVFDVPEFDQNIYFFPYSLRNQTNIFFPKGRSFEEWQKETGNDLGSIVTNPNFFDKRKDDFRLKLKYPASRLTVGRLNLLEVKKLAGFQNFKKEQDNEKPLRPKK